jgi:hypothetical protein
VAVAHQVGLAHAAAAEARQDFVFAVDWCRRHHAKDSVMARR